MDDSQQKLKDSEIDHNDKLDQQIQKLLQSQIYNEANQSLDLYTKQSQNKWQHLIKHKDWQPLKKLELNACPINQLNFHMITQRQWPNLKRLSLSSCKLKYRGMKLLVRSNIQNLQNVWLCNCGIQNEGAKVLSKANWPLLKMIHIGSNRLGIQGCRAIAQNNWRDLNLLRVSQNNQSPVIAFSFMLNQSRSTNIELSIEPWQQLRDFIIALVQSKSRTQY